jgi:hypothetical protein
VFPFLRVTPCAATPNRQSCGDRIALDPPPARPDPWTYDKSTNQIAQFTAWQASPATAKPPVFWIPPSVNLYPNVPPDDLPTSPSPFVEVTVANNSAVAAINTVLQLSMSRYGIGRKEIPVVSQFVNLSSQQSLTLSFPVPSSFLTEIWFGAYVDLQHPYDQNVLNNHATSMWRGADVEPTGGRNVVRVFEIPVANEFSMQAENVTLTVIPVMAGVVEVAPLLGTVVVVPGQELSLVCNLRLPPLLPGFKTILTPLATVIGTDSKGDFVGGVTVVARVRG